MPCTGPPVCLTGRAACRAARSSSSRGISRPLPPCAASSRFFPFASRSAEAEIVTVQPIQYSMPEEAVRFLQDQSVRLAGQRVSRPWHYAELHNPWARAAALYDSWGFLDLCQSPSLLAAIAGQIGEDLILFDSQWLTEAPQRPTGEVA